MENEEKNKIEVLKKILQSIEAGVSNALRLLDSGKESSAEEVQKMLITSAAANIPIDAPGVKVIEGVFDGTHMVGSDGKQYSIPPNYASKSKLVEGDMLKLTITPDGKFLYKQIGPIERDRIIGTLTQDLVSKQFAVVFDDKKWQVLNASITYFKGESGDEAVILIPKNGASKWAAVENVIKKF